MPQITVLSREQHTQKRWQRIATYAFAAGEAVLPLVGSELPKASMSLPIAFIRQGDGYVPAAVLGLEPGKNLFVAQDGRWVGQYIPAALRSYPFVIVRSEDQQLVLCVDEDSGLITDGPQGEPLFAEDGNPTQAVQAVLEFLAQVEQSRVTTATACAALEKHGCIRPWPITHKIDATERKIDGLFQIDEAALNALSDDAFLELRQSGALLIAYCQLLAMQHLHMLGQLAEAHSKAAAPMLTKGKDLDLSFLSDGEIFKFGGLH